MIRINLLPFRAARKKENVRRQVSIFILSLFLVSIIAVTYNLVLSGQIDSLEKKIKDTKDQLAKYNKINEEIKDIKNKLAVLNKKIEVIKSLDLNRKEPVSLLESMSELNVSNRMWLTNFNTNETTVKVQGIALDNQTVADYMTRLEESALFQTVKLSKIEKIDAPDKSLSLKEFVLSFSKTQPANSEKEAKKK